MNPASQTDAIVSAIASEALTLNKIDDDGEMYEPMPIEQDQVRAVLSSVSNTLDVATFANAVSNAAATSKFKVSVGSTSMIPPDEEDDLWSNSEPISMMVDLNDLEASLTSLEAQLSAVGKAAKGVSAEHLSKVWSIDLDTAKKTIDLTTQLCKHGESDHLRRQYSTNDRMLRYKRINTHFFTDTFQK